MLGVIVNTLTVIAGSLIGLLCRRGIPKKVSDAIMYGIGLCTVMIAISGMLEGQNALITIIAVALGAVVGTLLDIDAALSRLAGVVTKRFTAVDPAGMAKQESRLRADSSRQACCSASAL